MSHVVLKAFHTVNRRFRVGDPVSQVDVREGSSLTFQELVERAFIAPAARAPGPQESGE